MPLNSYLSLNMNAYDSDDEENNTTVMEVFNNDTIEDPLDTITKKEYYKSVELAIDKSLSKFEKKVLNRYVQGESYVQIAEKLDAPVKSVDNALTFRQSLSCLFKRSPVRNPKRIPIREICPISDFQPKYLF